MIPMPSNEERMEWWREARFGLFIHWGIYSVPAGEHDGVPVPGYSEWLMKTAEVPVAQYAKYAKEFTGSKFDAKAIVRLAKAAGMKYIVFTAKHHEGFSLFASQVSSFNSVEASPFGRDAVRELAEACASEEMKFGVYYSHSQDWHHQGGAGNFWDPLQQGDYDAYLEKIAVPQIRELLTQYGPICCLWYDTPRHITNERAELFRPLHSIQPQLITNDRLHTGHPVTGGKEGDTETPEQYIPVNGIPGKDWETCMTLNDSWGFKSGDVRWKSPGTLLRHLSDIVSKGGNFLLNIGPTSEGEIPEENVKTLEFIGHWMRRNGEAIYGTEASPFTRRLPWGRATRKSWPSGGSTIYLHIWNPPANGKLLLPDLQEIPTKMRLLGENTSPEFRATDAGLEILLPCFDTQWIIPIVAVDFSNAAPLIHQKRPSVGEDGRILLVPQDAELAGDEIEPPYVSGEAEQARITNLNRGSWRVQYSFDTPADQIWKVTAEVAPCAYNRLILSPGGIQDPSTTTTILAWTHGPGDFVAVDFGYFHFPAGMNSLEFRPELPDLRPLEIRRVWLSPQTPKAD